MATTPGEFVWQLNRLAGTTLLGPAGAANAWAGTTGLELIGALNSVITASHPAKVTDPSQMLGLNGVCNALAGTTGLEAQAALGQL